eukprot:TRINITY_DN6109_c0_g1_i1.p1 TRINITY_DN6109_c0_g1~~TRINITY_DN6109_c0_g1_i1.p1  ORF type:complete len:526 (+),score=81.68 TRINITY_DN6109_c0_g1_i1:13-1590(+)
MVSLWSVLLLCLCHCQGQLFTIKDNEVLFNGDWIKFKGIGLTCTEYMLKPGMDDLSKSYLGSWAWNYCFGGPPAKDEPPQLNDEINNILPYLIPDGMEFKVDPQVKKVPFPIPYSEVISSKTPKSRPIVRIPMTGSSYLYDIDSGNATLYQNIIDLIVNALTSKGIAVVLDLHWSCPDTSKLQGCQVGQAAMAQRNYGSQPGTLTFWDVVSKKYSSNPFVFYELYNEPWIQNFQPWYSGDSTFVGMKEMYDVIRKNNPNAICIIGGKDQYALDAQSGLAFYLKYKEDVGVYPTNIIWNIHPYQGASQGLEHSLRSVMRISLALKQIGPVIFTEFGQYCCGSSGACKPSQCNDHLHSDNFVYNIVNLSEQYDLSWIGWAWRGTNVNNANRPCLDGMADCNGPDMRDLGGILTDGLRGGAPWRLVWSTFVASSTIEVNDMTPNNISKASYQPMGFLPRPCIVGEFNLGGLCGYDLATGIETINYADIISQSLYDSILPGLPPLGHCGGQGCAGYPCQTYTGPCKKFT